MIKKELEELEKLVMKELVSRRSLGGFDANAETILKLTGWMYEIVRHLNEQLSRKK
jgi:hypothetical protein